MRPLVIEGRILVDTGKPEYRWICARCGTQGAWHKDLSDAEDHGRLHERIKHAEGARA